MGKDFLGQRASHDRLGVAIPRHVQFASKPSAFPGGGGAGVFGKHPAVRATARPWLWEMTQYEDRQSPRKE